MDGTAMYNHPEFPRYLVAPDGRVFSLWSKRFLQPLRLGDYLGFMITDAAGTIVKRYAHRLVLEAVVGPCPMGMQARHLNGDKHDNRVANLAWGTKEQNERDKVAHGTTPRGIRNGAAKLSWTEVRQIRALSATGIVQRRLAERFGVSLMTVNRVIRGESWQEATR